MRTGNLIFGEEECVAFTRKESRTIQDSALSSVLLVTEGQGHCLCPWSRRNKKASGKRLAKSCSTLFPSSASMCSIRSCNSKTLSNQGDMWPPDSSRGFFSLSPLAFFSLRPPHRRFLLKTPCPIPWHEQPRWAIFPLNLCSRTPPLHQAQKTSQQRSSDPLRHRTWTPFCELLEARNSQSCLNRVPSSV